MNTARTAVRAAASMRALGPRGKGSRIITYHSVRPDGPGRRSSYVSPADMQAQLTWLAREYEVVPLSTITRALEQGRLLPASWVSITFDDGYMDNYQYAYPILRALNLPATIFVITGKIGRDPAFLTLDQIAEMHGGNIAFGAHTVDHIPLTSMPAAAAKEQVIRSKQQLEQILGEPVQHFCYPHGHFNATIESFVREAGFRSCCTENSGAVSNASDPLRLLRVGILGTDTQADFRLKVRGAYDWWINLFMMAQQGRRGIRGGMRA
ncbi:MAG: polysaccharide deacetylase [Firmicutes bacterium]|nr:polysaccharide deacetylase [Bacillota bacterium]